MWPNSQETEGLITFTEEIFNGKLHFFYSEVKKFQKLTLGQYLKQKANISIYARWCYKYESQKLLKAKFMLYWCSQERRS